MEFFIKISKNGDMALESSEGSVQYVAKYKGAEFSGSVFDDLALTELVAIKNEGQDFSVSAFDSLVGTFKKVGNRFLYATENDTYKIEQSGATFLLSAQGSEVGTVKREGSGFCLTVTGGMTPLMGFALVIVVIAAKSLESAAAQERKAAEPPKKQDANPEIKQEIKEVEAETKETTDKAESETEKKEKEPIFPQIISIIKKSNIGKKLLSGSKIALIIALVGLIGLIASVAISGAQRASLSELKKAEAIPGKKTSIFTYGIKTYSFETPETYIEGAPLYVYYTEETKTLKSGAKETSIDKFYSTYPTLPDFTAVTVLCTAALILGSATYVLTAFGILTKDNLILILKLLHLKREDYPEENDVSESNTEGYSN